ncbi:MAG TPA: MmcQ/YjbR family DNA-binding protein [Anaerolineae bacterium]|jgi:hypothetical protein
MNEVQLERVRRICLSLPETSEKPSHGEAIFLVRKKTFAMFANNHHGDGHVAVWAAAPEGMQAMLLDAAPDKYYYPPYVGGRGWIGIELALVNDEELAFHLREAWLVTAPKKLSVAFSQKSA